MTERPFTNASYEQFLNEDKLMGSRCQSCGALFLPPRSLCINCYGTQMEWLEMPGEGRLVTFTCIAVGLPSMIAEGFNRENPYCSGVVELLEGLRVDARIVGVDANQPETITTGIPLTAEFLHRGDPEDLTTILAFRPAENL